MLEAENADQFMVALSELERAEAHFKAVLAVHSAAISAFEVLPTLPESEGILTTSLRLKRGMQSTDSLESLACGAQSIHEAMAAERDRGFRVIRGSALIAACAAFEYLIKATFVSQALLQPSAAAALLADTKVKVLAADVLGTPPMEQWFAIADQLFEQMPDKPRQMHLRVRRLLLQYTYVTSRDKDLSYIELIFGTMNVAALDEAFLTRNCLVHNGGRVSSDLARHTRRRIGEPITFDAGAIAPMLKPMRDLAGVLSALKY
jgi:hypothetical protein